MLPLQVLEAPEHWRSIDFISDLHLQESEPATFEVWQRYMLNSAAHAVFILGDLFEVWVGDDAVQSSIFLQKCAQVLKLTAASRHVAFMRGNRDFLVGPDFLQACNVQNLNDPTVLSFGTQRWLLSHGDEACLADTEYQAFRQKVRTPEWQQDFLAQPLAVRLDVARGLRMQSESTKKNALKVQADVDETWALGQLREARCNCLLHGHTHKPADHDLGTPSEFQRRVLSDWDAKADTPRAEVLRWHSTGQVERIALMPHP